jgi:hypothetical protein
MTEIHRASMVQRPQRRANQRRRRREAGRSNRLALMESRAKRFLARSCNWSLASS